MPQSSQTGSNHRTSKVTAILAAIGLTADIAGLISFAKDTVLRGNLENFVPRLFVLVLIFILVITLALISVRGIRNNFISQIAKLYVWVYLLVTCFTYAGISWRLNLGNYSFNDWIAYVALIIAELLAVLFLWDEVDNLDIRQLSIPLILSNIVQLFLILFKYIYTSSTHIQIFHLGGELIFFTGMSMVGFGMYGRWHSFESWCFLSSRKFLTGFVGFDECKGYSYHSSERCTAWQKQILRYGLSSEDGGLRTVLVTSDPDVLIAKGLVECPACISKKDRSRLESRRQEIFRRMEERNQQQIEEAQQQETLKLEKVREQAVMQYVRETAKVQSNGETIWRKEADAPLEEGSKCDLKRREGY